MATITLNLTHITCAEGISITQNEGTPVLLHLTPDSNYILPNSITFGSAIVGGVYDMPNKTISFTMPATNSTITAVAVQLNTLDKVIVDKQTFIDRETAIANALSGLRPTQYLKSIVKTEVDRLIEITYSDAGGDHNVSFEYGFTQPTWDIIGGDPATSTGLTTYLETNYIHSSERATANGVATLDASGHIPTEQLAGSVAEVKEGYYHDGEFYEESTYVTPLPHLENAIYFDKGDSYKQYRWVGSSFVAIANNLSVNSARDVGTATSAYRADFGVANYNDILTLQTGKQPLLSATNKLNTEFIATDTNARFVTDLEKTAWSNKQNALTFDITPTESSTNPVTSGGIKTYVDGLTGFSTGTLAAATNVSNSSSFYVKIGKLVVMSIKAKATAGKPSGTTLVTGGPSAAVDAAGVVVSDAGGKRVLVAAGTGNVTLDGSSIASGDWFNGTIVYYTN